MRKKLLFLIMFLNLLNSCKNKTTDSSDINSIISIGQEPEQQIKEIVQWDSIKSDDDYAKFITLIKSNDINQKQTIKTEYGKEEIVYLGPINDENGKIMSYILTLYGEVQAAIQIHGHSQVIFINPDLVQKKEYYLNMPEELPFKLEGNTLYFEYINEETGKENLFLNEIGTELPRFMCYAPNTCS